MAVASRVIHPLACEQVDRAGVRLLPMVSFLALALGLIVIGQTVALLSRMGATNYAGIIMVTVVVRELGPLIVALLVLHAVVVGDYRVRVHDVYSGLQVVEIGYLCRKVLA